MGDKHAHVFVTITLCIASHPPLSFLQKVPGDPSFLVISLISRDLFRFLFQKVRESKHGVKTKGGGMHSLSTQWSTSPLESSPSSRVQTSDAVSWNPHSSFHCPTPTLPSGFGHPGHSTFRCFPGADTMEKPENRNSTAPHTSEMGGWKVTESVTRKMGQATASHIMDI